MDNFERAKQHTAALVDAQAQKLIEGDTIDDIREGMMLAFSVSPRHLLENALGWVMLNKIIDRAVELGMEGIDEQTS